MLTKCKFRIGGTLDQWSFADLAFSTGKSGSANAPRSTLLGLPVEIRTMILRMVVGDQRISVPGKTCKAARGLLGFEVFASNRQLWGEAFPLFWRTSRIFFDEGDYLERFLDRLTECQKSNLRNLAMNVHFDCDLSSWYDDYDLIYRRIKRQWPSCDLKTQPLIR